MAATAQTTDAQSAEPAKVLEAAAPLSRKSLYDAEVAEALWQLADEWSDVNQTAFGVSEVYRAFEHSPAFEYEIRTALDYHDCAEFRDTSRSFRNEIARSQ